MKSWQEWLLFSSVMILVFMLGIGISSLLESRKEIATITYTQKVKITGVEARSPLFSKSYPREYQTWADTVTTHSLSDFRRDFSVDILAQRPEMVVLWAGYTFSKDYSTPRGHMYALNDAIHSLRTGAPMKAADGPQPSSCWACKSPDVPRLMQTIGVDSFYRQKWAALGSEIVNPVGCADCHEPENMNLHISRPALIEAFSRQGKDVNKASFTDYIHKLSRALILKAQHPDYEIFRMGIHAQRGVSCADCHMPYDEEGGIKYSDHHIQNPLAVVERTCQTCHRDNKETLRHNVYERQQKADELRNLLEKELTTAHIEAKFAWDKGATENEMQEALTYIRQAQWRWDFGVSSHGASFHAPQEIMRILGHGLDKAYKARMAIAKVLMRYGYSDDVPLPDISTKQKAQQYIGLDISTEKVAKEKFLKEVVPMWIQEAKENKRIAGM